MIVPAVKKIKTRHYRHPRRTPMGVTEVTARLRMPPTNIRVRSRASMGIHSMGKAISISTKIGSILKVDMGATISGAVTEVDIAISFCSVYASCVQIFNFFIPTCISSVFL